MKALRSTDPKVRTLWGAGSVLATASAIWGTHFISMLAYQVQGELIWHMPTVALSVGLGVLFTAVSAHPAFWRVRAQRWVPPVLFVLAVCATHFFGMTAFETSMDLQSGLQIDPLNTGLLVLLVANVAFSIFGRPHGHLAEPWRSGPRSRPPSACRWRWPRTDS